MEKENGLDSLMKCTKEIDIKEKLMDMGIKFDKMEINMKVILEIF